MKLKALVSTFFISALALTSVRAQFPPHLEAGQLLVEQITACQAQGVLTDAQGVSINRYGGSWSNPADLSFIRFQDVSQNILPGNYTQCSSLVTRILQNRYNWSWKNYVFLDPITNAPKSSASPEAYQYCALIKQQLGFNRVFSLQDAQPGDILSWWEVGKSSGDHTMMIESVNWASAKPYLNGYLNSNPALAGTTYYEVTVIDCSSSTHTNDSRMVMVNGVSTHIRGIGRGKLGLLVNANFQIVGHTWSLPTKPYSDGFNWVKDLNGRLKLSPVWEAVIGRKL